MAPRARASFFSAYTESNLACIGELRFIDVASYTRLPR